MRRNKHSLSHYQLATCDMGELIPVGLVEVLPGDTIQQATSALIRVSPMQAPVMHPVQVRIHHWYVPNRIIWDEWEDFITGGPDNDFQGAFPSFTTGSPAADDVTDYLGIPPVQGLDVSLLPIRAYNLIYNEFYRDQDLVAEVPEDDIKIKQCAWEKDYFTASRPWPQKGPEVTLPVGTQAPIVGLGVQPGSSANPGPFTLHETGGDVRQVGDAYQTFNVDITSTPLIEEDPNNEGFPAVYADLSATSAVPINDFRRAFALQRYAEARARYGSRYTEYLRYLGIRPSDARLQRPEYLGGGKQTIAFSEVLQTAPDEQGPSDNFVGDLYGHGIAALRTRRYRRFFEEHGHVISLMSVRPKTMYSNSLHRKWSRREKEDYYQRELETIGQQEVYSREVFAEPSPNGDAVFGYADRYREYREEPSIVTGEFRNLLNYWHMSREFANAPVLNQSFVDCVPTKRIHSVETNDVLWCMTNHHIQARRLVNRSAHSRII